ncbi:hypothetical protein EJ08DRAFT_63564 [Tothia fuscella]|uniref:C2H2-type domain-containing protein n=1 Tax=Tothia fuscella TaxID=1048955 RepID=A0A9P4TT20_9PEZI|nr:hypothetical protein EJ08DRAFT_63564 [Tothia fuscella]
MCTTPYRGDSMSLKCLWSPCPLQAGTASPICTSHSELTRHQEAHALQLCEQWAVPSQCHWPYCSSIKKCRIFSTRRDMQKHIHRAHIKRYWCSQRTCNLGFSAPSDFNRHAYTAHSEERNYLCSVEDCNRSFNGFSRVDKLNEHKRRDHENVLCPFDHCGMSMVEIDWEKHVNRFHFANSNYDKVYECSLPGCESTDSKFTYVHAQKHLEKGHGLNWSRVNNILHSSKRIDETEPHSFMLQNDRAGRSDVSTDCKPCVTCAKKHSTVESQGLTSGETEE